MRFLDNLVDVYFFDHLVKLMKVDVFLPSESSCTVRIFVRVHHNSVLSCFDAFYRV